MGPEQMAGGVSLRPPEGPHQARPAGGGRRGARPSLSGGNGRQRPPQRGGRGRRDPAKDKRPCDDWCGLRANHSLTGHQAEAVVQTAGTPEPFQRRRAERSD